MQTYIPLFLTSELFKAFSSRIQSARSCSIFRTSSNCEVRLSISSLILSSSFFSSSSVIILFSLSASFSWFRCSKSESAIRTFESVAVEVVFSVVHQLAQVVVKLHHECFVKLRSVRLALKYVAVWNYAANV